MTSAISFISAPRNMTRILFCLLIIFVVCLRTKLSLRHSLLIVRFYCRKWLWFLLLFLWFSICYCFLHCKSMFKQKWSLLLNIFMLLLKCFVNPNWKRAQLVYFWINILHTHVKQKSKYNLVTCIVAFYSYMNV